MTVLSTFVCSLNYFRRLEYNYSKPVNFLRTFVVCFSKLAIKVNVGHSDIQTFSASLKF